VEAQRLMTVDDLLAWTGDERVELIDGEIVQRPMSRFEHGQAQTVLIGQSFPLVMRQRPGGWWIVPEISVRYSEHHCPSHDLAGWRRERLPERPSGVVDLAPDWVCEIVSPGHERKDTLTLLLLLQRHRVPHYWLIWPEERTLVAYGLDGGSYRIVANRTASGPDAGRAAIPPFEVVPIDLGYILGG